MTAYARSVRTRGIFLFITAFIVLANSTAFGFDAVIGLSETATTDPEYAVQFQTLTVSLMQSVLPFRFVFDVDMTNDGKYTIPYSAPFLFGYYPMIRNGGIELLLSPFSLRAGRMTHSDVVDTPYSLFVSSNPNPAVLVDLEYEDRVFFYSSRWLQLNTFSALYPFDRGSVLKTYGIRAGEFRIGFQDAAIFTHRSFDPEYFFSPLPSLVTQYVNFGSANPWAQSTNDNSIMGIFMDYRHSFPDPVQIQSIYAYFQLLIDDFNFNRIADPSAYQNPDKIAWSIGSALSTPYGIFGLYHAGATKYTFEPFGNSSTNTLYGYTYYPDSSYSALDSTRRPIPLEENYIGYLHGENNIAFKLTFNNPILEYPVHASLEFVLSGSVSPANPWHELLFWDEGGQGTKFLDDPVLEKKLVFSGAVSRDFFGWTFELGIKAGYVWNALLLGESPDLVNPANTIRILKPSAADLIILQAAIAIKYTWKVE